MLEIETLENPNDRALCRAFYEARYESPNEQLRRAMDCILDGVRKEVALRCLQIVEGHAGSAIAQEIAMEIRRDFGLVEEAPRA